MHEIVISDTSCLVILSNIDELDVLQKIYSKIVTTPEVAREFGQVLPDWIEIKAAANSHYQHILEL